MTPRDPQAVAFRFEEIYKGQSKSFDTQITQAMMDCFGTLSGDLNPLHVDAAFAQSVGHPAPVVYGMLVASLFSQLVGMYLPGKFSLLHQVDVSFRHPVYVGDILTLRGEVSDVFESVRQIELKGTIYNQNMKKVAVGKIKVGMYA